MAVSQRPNPDILTGNDAIVKLNGIAVGFMKSLQVTINNHVERIQAIGYRKPRGLKSLDWQGSASAEFHILRSAQEGVVKINSNDDSRADDLYDILIIDKSTGRRVGLLVGAVQSDGFNLSNNEFSGRNVEFELLDFEPLEAYN
ncbi:hypothetical protein [Leptospira sp. id769339]|uniref:hypothetical protein n=1 Tax=Leptospira sp. id769339 TaxID=2864221 RepID=UPI00214A9C11|nr:hypothetical protein [Leptospira sp. id769339]MCR1794910.1 hypothetical protein [Leptospira sp. id769339]